jgi:DNA-binding response OmpR family regulator
VAYSTGRVIRCQSNQHLEVQEVSLICYSTSAESNTLLTNITAQRTSATLISTALNKAGYAVVLAGSGEEAYHKIVRKMPQGVITDITLPRMDGVALCKLLRRNPFTCLLPVVLLIPNATMASLGASADDYLIMPFQPQEVVVRITNLIARVQNLAQYQIESEAHTFGRTLAIFAGKGGVGKTTLTINLAIAL